MNNEATIGVLDQFQTDLVASWQRLPNKTFFFVLLAAWLALFQFLGSSILGYIHTPSLYAWLWEGYSSPQADDGHGPLIPILVLGVLWWKRKELLDLRLGLWLPAVGLLIAAMLLHLIGFTVQEPRISVAALFIGIYGLTGLAWGPQWLRRSVFPFFLFVFSIPLGAGGGAIVTFPLRLMSTRLVEFIWHDVLSFDLVRVGTQLINPVGGYQYDVAPACSGIRSLVAILLMATVYGFLVFRSPWKRILLVVLSVPFAVIGNMVRLLAIVIAAQMGGQKWGDAVHNDTVASLIPYIPAIFGFLKLGQVLEKWETRDTEKGKVR